MEKIKSAGLVCRREPLNTHFGFKGGSLTELWQVCCRLETDGGSVATGQSVQSVLWSDSAVFAQWGQDGGNEKMLALTRFALELLPGRTLEQPPRMLEKLLPEVLKEGLRLLAAGMELRVPPICRCSAISITIHPPISTCPERYKCA